MPALAALVADQGPDTADRLKVVVLVFTLGGAAVPRVGAGAATADVYQRHGRLELGLRVLRRVPSPRGFHLGVLLNVRVVRVVEGAGAVLAAGGVAIVTFLAAWCWGSRAHAAREVAEEVEGLAECFLGGAGKGTRRVHAVHGIAQEERSIRMAFGQSDIRKTLSTGKGDCAGKYASPVVVGPLLD